MHDALLLLHLDHVHAARLLDLMEQQLVLRDGPDVELMSDMVGYFLDYPDQCHHPVEDAIYECIARIDPERAKNIALMLDDHERLNATTKTLAGLVDRAASDDDVRTGSLKEQARHFIASYRSHMAKEESAFFPVAEEVLREDDWDAVAFDLFDRNDPLHDSSRDARFHSLRQRIERRSKQTLARAEALRGAGQLRGLTDISSFNTAMGQAKRPYLIAARDAGGYSLHAHGSVLIDIPPCSEGRAAWCAWFYLKQGPSA